MTDSDGDEVTKVSLSNPDDEAASERVGSAAEPVESSGMEQDVAEGEESGDDEPSGESLQGGDEDNDSDGSAGSINEFVVGDDEDDDDEEGDVAAADGDDDAPMEVDAKLLRKKMKRRRKRFDSEIQEEAEELLATGGKKHRVRIGDEAAGGDGKKSKASDAKSHASSESDDYGPIGGTEKKIKPEKGARSMDMKYKEEDDDENQRDYTNAFSADFFGQDADDAAETKQPVVRVVDPMEEFESFQTADDKIAVTIDIPERIYDALPPGKVTLNDMAEWQRTIAPRVVAYELKSIAADLLKVASFESSGARFVITLLLYEKL